MDKISSKDKQSSNNKQDKVKANTVITLTANQATGTG
jgi:hypothetical protein